MIFNSDIIIVNNTPERGRVTGKRTRLTGATGRLHALVNHGYEFKHWLNVTTGQVISTSNPLVINSWESMEIEAVFDHLILDTAFYEARDALETETWNLERSGAGNYKGYLETTPSHSWYGDQRYSTSGLTYYTQGVRNFVQTRTSDVGVTYNTYAHNYGYSYVNGQPLTVAATYDAATDTTVGSFYRNPKTYDEPPLSGIPAEYFMPRTQIGSQDRNAFSNSGVSQTRSHPNNNPATSPSSYYSYPFFGVRNNPTVGQSTQFPMIEYTNIVTLYLASGWREDFDSTGMEHVRHLLRLQTYPYAFLANSNNSSHPGDGSVIRNLDGLINNTDLQVIQLGEGPVKDGAYRELLYDRTRPNPRLYEVFGYFPHVDHYILNNNHKYHNPGGTGAVHKSWGQPTDTQYHTASSAEWIPQYQNAPSVGSLLYNTRYSKHNSMHMKRAYVTDFTVYKRYGKSLKQLIFQEPWYANTADVQFWQTPDFGDLTGLKNLKTLYIHNNSNPCYEGSIENWEGLKDCTSLQYLYINGDSKLTENIKYSYIPTSAKYINIYPPPLPTTANPFEGELVVGSFVTTTTGLSSTGRHLVQVINHQTTMETLT